MGDTNTFEKNCFLKDSVVYIDVDKTSMVSRDVRIIIKYSDNITWCICWMDDLFFKESDKAFLEYNEQTYPCKLFSMKLFGVSTCFLLQIKSCDIIGTVDGKTFTTEDDDTNTLLFRKYNVDKPINYGDFGASLIRHNKIIGIVIGRYWGPKKYDALVVSPIIFSICSNIDPSDLEETVIVGDYDTKVFGLFNDDTSKKQKTEQ